MNTVDGHATGTGTVGLAVAASRKTLMVPLHAGFWIHIQSKEVRMYLSSLKITGFKSYSQPISIDFDPKIAVLIGSNGVGKSNALDAIVWALGEDDPQILRIGSQGDLFFAGSHLNLPAQDAFVELAFEEAGQQLVVSRALGRSGAQDLHIGGNRVENLDRFRGSLDEIGLGSIRQNVVRQEELTDFFVKRTAERNEYLGRYCSSQEDLNQINFLFETYMSALVPGCHARISANAHKSEQVEVEVTFADKGPKRGVLLSGGEKAVTALALKLALFGIGPGPTYLLDEVEPSLDWTHNHNMQELLKAVSRRRQLIIVTHTRSTIGVANTVHGVRLRSDGSSWLKFHFVMDERLFKIYGCC
jgi:chromosome segregation ATPase